MYEMTRIATLPTSERGNPCFLGFALRQRMQRMNCLSVDRIILYGGHCLTARRRIVINRPIQLRNALKEAATVLPFHLRPVDFQ